MSKDTLLKMDLLGDIRQVTGHDETLILRDAGPARWCGREPLDSIYSRGNNDSGAVMDYCHQHNLVDQASAGQDRSFGIRVTLPANDTLRNILGDGWERLHWYGSEVQRDAAFDDMAARHSYSRKTDTPTQILKKITR